MNPQTEAVTYAGFWPRTWAYIIDAVLVGLFSGGIGFYNFFELKSFWVYLAAALIGGLYKPLMEKYFSATLGKMALQLKVVDYDHQSISLDASFIRSVFSLAPVLFYIPYYYRAYNTPSLMEINDILEFTVALTQTYPSIGIIGNFSMVIVMVEIIVLLTDSQMRYRSLHDRLAKTYVIKSI